MRKTLGSPGACWYGTVTYCGAADALLPPWSRRTMVTFLWAHALWLMLLVPVLVGAYAALSRRRNSEYLRYTALGLVREVLAASQWIRRQGPPLLFLAGLIALLLAVARPAAVTTVQSQQGTVILAIDVSLSMAETDVASP